MRNWHYACRVSGLLLVLFLVACAQTPITDVQDPDNRYTPESVYLKEVQQYPQIRRVGSRVPDGIAAFTNLTYVSYGNRQLQLDLYAPATTMDEQRPAIVLVHGGGWTAGYRENLAPLAQQLALRGYVTATISYRLAAEARYPAAVHDVKAAVRWMRVNADRYGINPEKIALAGTSSGGQIASLAGVTTGIDKFDPQAARSKVSSDVQAIINIDGLSDFTSEAARRYLTGSDERLSTAGAWLGGSYENATATWHEASPISYVNKHTPPILFIKSAEPQFSVGEFEMSHRLDHFRVNHHVEKFADAPHGFWMLYPWMRPTAIMMANFLDAQFAYVMNCH